MGTPTTTRRRSAEEIAADIRKTNAEAEKAEQEARLQKYLAGQAKLGLDLAKIKLDEAVENRELQLTSDFANNVYRFTGGVDAANVDRCLTTLSSWDRLDSECDIEIVFNSLGGSVQHGFALFDAITSLSIRGGGSHLVTATVRGWAASMGGILIQSGDVRRIGGESYLHIHEISTGVLGKVSELEDEVEFCKKMTKRVVDIFVSRSGGKVTERELRRKFERKELWLPSNEALALGLVDEIA